MNGRTANDDWHLPERSELSGGTLAWGRFGSGPPVVLVHGTPSWSFMWRKVVPPLTERFTVHVLDLIGYGDSERRDHQDMSVAAQSRALAELLDVWELERPGLVGHDIGGSVVLRAHLVEDHPAGRIALVDAAVLVPWNTPATVHIGKHLDAYRTMPGHIYDGVVSAHLRTAFHREPSAEVLASYVEPWRGEAGQAAYFRKIEQWRDEDMSILEPRLAEIDVPTLVLWGAEDCWLEPETGKRLASLIPDAHFALVADAGHFAMEDAPAAVAAELSRFLSG